MKQTVIGLVGFPATGKSTLGKQLSKEFNFSHINGDNIRNFLIENISYFNGTTDHFHNNKIKTINKLARPFKNKLITTLLDEGQSIIIDGYGKSKNKRKLSEKLLEKYDLNKIIIYLEEKEEIIIERLKQRDKKDTKASWVEGYFEKWKFSVDKPESSECDLLIEANSNDSEKIIKQIKQFLK